MNIDHDLHNCFKCLDIVCYCYHNERYRYIVDHCDYNFNYNCNDHCDHNFDFEIDIELVKMFKFDHFQRFFDAILRIFIT